MVNGDSYTNTLNIHNTPVLHFGITLESQYTAIFRCVRTCTDEGCVPLLHRDIMLIKATITLIFASLGIIYVEPQGTTIMCILI